jgi:hypothetical protein
LHISGSDQLGASNFTADFHGNRLLIAAQWCAIVVAIPQLLLAGLHAWILLDLHVFGTAIAHFALIFAAAFVVVQFAVLLFASTLRRRLRAGLLFLATAYVFGLTILVAMFVAMEFDVELGDWILQPGAKLPPNEIMGRDWPVGVAIMAYGLAQLLGILPLTLVAITLMRRPSLLAPAK